MATTRILDEDKSVLGRNNATERRMSMMDEEGVGGVIGRQKKIKGGRGEEAVVEEKATHSSLEQPGSTSEGSGVQHRLIHSLQVVADSFSRHIE